MNDQQKIELVFRCDTTETKDATKSTQALDSAVAQTNERLRDAKGRWIAVGSATQAATQATNAQVTASHSVTAALHAEAAATKAVATASARLTGAQRAGAMTRLGMGGLNIAQDMIQGGPASGINNILGMAGDGGIKALAAEGIAAAGGIGMIGAAFATVAVAAGAAFVVIDNGLKSASLGWSDLGTIMANSTPVVAATTAWQTLGVIAEKAGVTAAASFVYDGGAFAINTLANVTLGWDDACEAARRHNAELAEGIKATREYAEAVKELGKFRSDQQKDAEANGKIVGDALADLGGAKGIDGLASAIARMQVGGGGGEKVKVGKLNDKGEADGQEEITREEKARRDALALMNKARTDPKALADLTGRLKGAGYDTRGVEAAGEGVDQDAINKADEAESKKRTDATKARYKQEAKQAKDRDERAEEQAGSEDEQNSNRRLAATKERLKKKRDGYAADLKERYAEERLLGDGEVGASDIKAALNASGQNVSDETASAVLKTLRDDLDEAIRKRARQKDISFADAAKQVADEQGEDSANAQRKRLQGQLDKQRQKGQDARQTQWDAIQNDSGMADPIAQMMLTARNTGKGSANDLNMTRKFQRMTFQERQAYFEQRNDQTDKRLEGQVAKNLVRRGYTRDPNEAAAMAKQMVARVRGAVNDETGDTSGTKENTEATKRLTDAIEELNHKGLRIPMRP